MTVIINDWVMQRQLLYASKFAFCCMCCCRLCKAAILDACEQLHHSTCSKAGFASSCPTSRSCSENCGPVAGTCDRVGP